jgi:hypothetical protein
VDFTGALIGCNGAFNVAFAAGERTTPLHLTAVNDPQRRPRRDAEIVILPFDPGAPAQNAFPYQQWDDGQHVLFHRAIHIIDPNPPPPPPPQQDGGPQDGGPQDAGTD